MKRVTLIVIFLVYSTIAWTQSKIDFWLRDAVKIYQEAKGNALRNSASGIQIKLFKNQPIVDVILQTRDGNFSFLSNYGVTVKTVAGPYATVQLPIQAIDEIAAKENVVYICPHPKTKPLNDVALSITMVDSAISLGYTGKNVIMGVIDTGIDVTHPAFLDSAGSTRILYLWDQTVDGSGTSSPFYDFGKEWTKADIDAGLCTSVDTDGHGTHVAGSLAGCMINHVESIYHGGAIAANLIVVKGQIYTLDAINYIFEKARQLEKPAIINISLGSHYGPHDGSDPFIAARDFLTGPGRIIVQAAGNDGERLIHHMVDADADGESMNFTLQFPADSLLFELWHDGTQNVDMQIIGPAGVPNVVAPAGASGTVNSSNGNVTVDNASNGPENYNNDKRICVKLENNVAAGAWTFKLSTPSPTIVHAWMWNGDDDADFAFETTDNHYTLVNDACSRSSIVIGAYVSRTKFTDKDRTPQDWEDFLGPAGTVAKYSSGGPTRDGREKPDFVAPGGLVISAKSSNIPPAGQIYLDEFRSIGGRPDIWGAFQNYGMMGTSQACPQADNVAAAILEEDRDQTPSQLIENMKKSTQPLDEKNNDRNIKSNENRFDTVNWHYRSGYGLVTLTGFLNNIPRVTVLKQTTDDIIEICYNKPLNNANNPSNYQIIGPSSGLKVVAAIQDNNSIKLFLDNKMIEGVRDSLRISNVEGFNEPVVMEIDKLGTLVQPDFILTNYVWHAEDSPYYVTGTLQLPSWVTLTIEPATIVKFLPGNDETAEFQIFGALRAEGTQRAPIVFTSLDELQPGAWSGLYFDPEIPSTTLNHCIIKYADQAIVCFSDSLTVKNSVIAHTKDIGVFVQDATISMERTIIYDTKGGEFQDAIQLSRSSAHLENLTISGSGRAGVVSFSSSSIMRNSIITTNNMFGVYSDNNQSNIISYSDFWDNGNDIRNFTIDNGVIYKNPMFLNADTGNFSLSENSPCIDVGDPNSALDPDGTRVDMGALPFDHTIPVELAVFNAEVKDDDIILSWTTASETNNFGFEIQRRDEGKDFKKIGVVKGSGTSLNIREYKFIDKNLPPGNYVYRLKQIDFNGTFVFTDEVCAAVLPPQLFELYASYPNPFNSSTTLTFDIPIASKIKLQVLDINGKLVRTLLEEKRTAGRHRLVWDGTNIKGQTVASGIYFVHLKTNNFSKTIRTILIK